MATITKENISGSIHSFDRNSKYGPLGIRTFVTVCPNGQCKEITISAALFNGKYDPNFQILGAPIETWNLRPLSKAKPFPDYIPKAILDDYIEACLIQDLSPKASATLARRCLQGMIRDFWKITKPRLIDEIAALHGQVDPTTWGAIDAVRKIGNIGAHMEKDISVIVDVDTNEAEMLLHLIEVLLNEWYIRRHDREQHMAKIIAAATAKLPTKGSP